MWRIGFRIWSVGQYVKRGAVGLLLLALIWNAQGFSPLFWLVLAIAASVLYGARSTLLNLARRESGGILKGGKR